MHTTSSKNNLQASSRVGALGYSAYASNFRPCSETRRTCGAPSLNEFATNSRHTALSQMSTNAASQSASHAVRADVTQPTEASFFLTWAAVPPPELREGLLLHLPRFRSRRRNIQQIRVRFGDGDPEALHATG